MGSLKGWRGSRDHPTMGIFSSGIRQRWRCAFSLLYESGPSLVSGCCQNMELRPGNHEKAWNDPPMFAYQPASTDSAGSNAPANKRTLLNKRVAFPMSGSSPVTSNTAPPTSTGPPLLPLLPSGASSTSLSLPTVDSVIGKETITSEDLNAEGYKDELSFVKQTFSSALEILEDKDKQDELERRILSLYTCWEEERLNPNIQNRLLKLCQHMKNKEYTAANTLQVSLAVDYTSECSPWILAVKNLITCLSTETPQA